MQLETNISISVGWVDGCMRVNVERQTSVLVWWVDEGECVLVWVGG